MRWPWLVVAALVFALAINPGSALAGRQELSDNVMDCIHAKGLNLDILIEPIVLLPNAPTQPLEPSDPSTPLTPEAPSAPFVPASPLAPSDPGSPGAPSLPQAPASVGEPTAPTAPSGPLAPFAPTAPTAPTEPSAPSEPHFLPVIPNQPVDIIGEPVVDATVVGGEVVQGSVGPTVPTAPNAPATPRAPATPATPATPRAPATPATPRTPTAPTAPTIIAPEVLQQAVNSVTITESQNGFQGLVSVTAVDSVVPVLMNIYININSTAGSSTSINVLELKTIQADL